MRSFLTKIHWPFFLFVTLFFALNLARVVKFDKSIETPLDQRQPFFAGRLYNQGLDPYDDELLKKEWTRESKEKNFIYSKLPGGPENYMLYPPFVVSLYSLSHSMSWQSWGDLSYVLVLLSLVILLLLIHSLYDKKEVYLFLGFLLAYKGLTPSLLLAQPLWFALLFIGLSLYFKNKNFIAGGFFLALSALKPSIALPVFFFFLAIRPKQFFTAGAFLLLFHIPFFMHYGNSSLSIIESWFSNMQAQTAIVENTEFSFLSSNLIDISPWLGYLNLPLAIQSLLLAISLIGLSALLFFKKIEAEYGLLLLCLCTLSFSYHLFYDAYLLLFCIPALRRVDWWRTLPLLILFLPSNFWFSFNIQIWAVVATSVLVTLQYPNFRMLKSV